MSDDILDDFLSGFDIPAGTMSPLTPEEFVMQRLTEGKNSHIAIVRYNLMQQLEFRDMLRKQGVIMRRDTVEHGIAVARELTTREFARVVCEDYIKTRHHATLEFATHDGRGKVNMAKLMDLVCEHDTLKNVIEDTFFLRRGIDGIANKM